jgi:hypothetical protein
VARAARPGQSGQQAAGRRQPLRPPQQQARARAAVHRSAVVKGESEELESSCTFCRQYTATHVMFYCASKPAD